MAAPKEMSCNFKMDEQMNDWFCREVANMDLTKSEVIRTCILMSLDTIKNNPRMTQYMNYSDRSQ